MFVGSRQAGSPLPPILTVGKNKDRLTSQGVAITFPHLSPSPLQADSPPRSGLRFPLGAYVLLLPIALCAGGPVVEREKGV